MGNVPIGKPRKAASTTTSTSSSDHVPPHAYEDQPDPVLSNRIPVQGGVVTGGQKVDPAPATGTTGTTGTTTGTTGTTGVVRKAHVTSAILKEAITNVCVSPHELKVCRTRVLKEYELMKAHPPMPNVFIAMDPINHLHWFCLIHSLQEDVYKDGEYLFHIALSPRYPFEAPDFYIYTPNGRFSIKTKLCFSNSSYHNESWSPIWSIKTIIMGFLSFFLDKESRGAGHLNNVTDEAKKKFAVQSKAYNEEYHSDILELIRHENEAFMAPASAHVVDTDKKT